MAGLVTLGELAMAVQQALAETAYPGQKSGRIRDVPDRRTIRYYTTIGLLDKPAEMRGRTAYYSRRHLMQLVAIKRLQARGKSLVEIQAALAGASESALRKWAELSDEAFGMIDQYIDKAEPVAPKPLSVQREEFWAVAPQAKAVAVDPRPAEIAKSALHLKVTDKVTLVIEEAGPDSFDTETLSRLLPALENLKNILEQNGGGVQKRSKHGNEPGELPQTNDSNREQS